MLVSRKLNPIRPYRKLFMSQPTDSYDTIIFGAGIVGLAIARALKAKYPDCRLAVMDKEDDVARHGSGRNSGVLHAGFYYAADSLKARFCRDGNRAMKAYCQQAGIPVINTQKLVVATREEEIPTLKELAKRAEANGVNASLITAKEAASIDPNAYTLEHALLSPETANVNPVAVSQHMKKDLSAQGVAFHFNCGFEKRVSDTEVIAGGKRFTANCIINSAGLYADKIARQFGFCKHYTIIPFKGVYLKYEGNSPPVTTNIYPVPNLKNPFLGVHFTLTAEGGVKIGPTAIPAFWRENYQGLEHFSLTELCEVLGWEAKLFATNAFNFRSLAFEEMMKYRKAHLIKLANRMVRHVDASSFKHWSTPGIRAQLLDKRSLSLVQDFAVEGDAHSVHILNAVSPAFTCSIPFGEWVVENYIAPHH